MGLPHRVITLYNHKGGVSKTTTTFNLAGFLARTGKRVLMIDADPQCNLTQIALASIIDERDRESVEKNEVVELPGTSVLDALNQRIRGDVAFIDIEQIQLNEVDENLLLLRGSVDLSSIEDDLAEAHVQRMTQRTNLMRTYVAVGDFVTRLAEKYRCDYVFIDVGPSSGALTRAFFLAADHFFVPAAPDRFNVQAVSTLSRIVERWIAEHRQAVPSYAAVGLPVKHGAPSFLGLIVQAFKIYKGQPKPAFKLWQTRLPVEVKNKLRPVLRKREEGLYLPGGLKEVAVSIPDFGQLAPLMQEVGKAVFALSQEDTARISESGKPWVGNNWTNAVERMESYRKCFEQLADILNTVRKK
ncbi:ParA family protein [Lysobacter arvi]|uniref:AAA family ATPase n=1 Tax=Lysobacter arvi TaxID=3038776 RepID=A0ABU1CBJ2_9GAMM|nr:AAA family ATPase [Lysobacter arvi]MDR0181535.1 AAA family ATPase [Lysobacter arvi]